MPDTIPPPVIVPAVSPTGQALLPAKYVPAAMAIASLPGAFAGALAAANAAPKAVLWLGIASGVLWAVLGVISPGLRRPAPQGQAHVGITTMLALAVAAMVGCATLKAFWSDTVDCAKHDAPEMLAQLPKVIAALAQQDYVTAVDQVAADLGDIAQCDVALLSAPPSPPPPSLGIIQQAQSDMGIAGKVRGNAAQYLAAKKLTVINVKPVAVKAP